MKKQILLLALFLFTIVLCAQKIKGDKGNIKNLKGVNEYNLIFDYSNIEISNYESEESFLKDKMDKREEEKLGDGEKFKKSWFNDRKKLYEPYFTKHFNEYFVMKRKIRVENNTPNLKYTMLVNTQLIYPGYNVGVFSERSKLKATITVHLTSEPNNILFSTKTIYIHDGRASYNTGIRIANTYGILGRKIAAYLRKKT